MNKQKS